jgi:hypothetical protein
MGRLSKRVILETAATLGADPDAPMQLAILDNEIAEGNYKQNNEVPIKMLDLEKMQYSNDWRTYRERNALLTKHRGQTFSLILGQCTQLLQDRMKQDTDWNTASTSYNPLELYWLIKKMTLAQMEDQYPFATVYDQEKHPFTHFGRRQCPTRNGTKNSTQMLMLDQLSA